MCHGQKETHFYLSSFDFIVILLGTCPSFLVLFFFVYFIFFTLLFLISPLISRVMPGSMFVWVLTQLVVIGQSKAVDVALFRHGEGEVGPAEGVRKVNLGPRPDLHQLGLQQSGCKHTHKSVTDTHASHTHTSQSHTHTRQSHTHTHTQANHTHDYVEETVPMFESQSRKGKACMYTVLLCILCTVFYCAHFTHFFRFYSVLWYSLAGLLCILPLGNK